MTGHVTVAAARPDLPPNSAKTLKRNVLDSITALHARAEQFSSRPSTEIVSGARPSMDQATFFKFVLVRYPDLPDTFLTDGGLCHPADNFGAVLAVCDGLQGGRGHRQAGRCG